MASIAEKINELEAPNGEIGRHHQTLIEMETEIEKVLRPMKTYLLMTYAWRCRIHATKDIDNCTGILRPSRSPKHFDDTVHEFIVLHNERDVAYFYFHYDLEKDTVYVTSESVATQEISTESIITTLKATIGLDE